MATGADGTGTISPTTAETCDRRLGAVMFWLGLAFLVLAAGVIHRIGHGFESRLEFSVITWTIFAIWPLFLAEGLLRVFVGVRTEVMGWRLLYLAVLVAAPPLRMGSRSYADSTKMWLPVWGWSTVDRHLRKRLEKVFSVPMMAIAFLVLPVLFVEHYWAEVIRDSFAAKLFLDIASSIIWMAFAAEFILMVSVAEKKWRYCLVNWMDVIIVVLPLLEFLPVLRLFRLTRLLALDQFARLYRLRGLMYKLWRAILLLDVMYRLMGDKKEKRLMRLKDLLTAKMDEVEDLKKEIDDLERELARCKTAGEAREALVPSIAPPAAPPAALAPAVAACNADVVRTAHADGGKPTMTDSGSTEASGKPAL